MCIYDRFDYACGHDEWGPMKVQCTRYWQKCCIRTCHDSFSHQKTSSCKTCQSAELEACGINPLARGSVDRDIGPSDTLNLTLRLQPFPVAPNNALHVWSHTSAQPKLANHEDVKAYLKHCIKRYQQVHQLPEDSVKISDSHHDPIPAPKPMFEDLDQERDDQAALQDYQRQLMFNPGQQRKEMAKTNQPNYWHFVEPEYKFAHQEHLQEHVPRCPIDDIPLPDTVLPQVSPIQNMSLRQQHLNDYRVQLNLLEQQNKKRLMMHRQQDKAVETPSAMDHEAEQIMEMEGALAAQGEQQGEKDDAKLVPEDDQDQAMWSIDEFDEWDNCGDLTKRT